MDKPARAGDALTTASDFHTRSVDEVVRAVAGDPYGLTTEQATRRLAEYGRNELSQTAGRHPVFRFLR